MKPFLNKSILVTRPVQRAEELILAILAFGGKVIGAPMMEIQKNEELVPEIIANTLRSSEVVIFLSVNAIEYSLIKSPDLIPFMTQKKLFAIGESTATKLQSLGLDSFFPKKKATSEGLLELEGLNPQKIKLKNVAVLKGVGGRRKLKIVLEKRGASVANINCYKRITTNVSIKKALRASSIEVPDVIVSTSSTIVKILGSKIESEYLQGLYEVPMVVPSSRVAQTARRLGFTGELIVAKGATTDAIINAVESWVWRN